MPKTEEQSVSTEMIQYSPNALELMHQLQIEPTDPNELAIIIAGRLAMAETPESLDAVAAETSWENHLGEPYLIRRAYYPPSSYDAGLPVYVLVEASHADTGEFAVLSTGAVGVVVAVRRAELKGWLDKPWKMIRADKATSNGFYPYRFVQA